jgi:hypothetical protein
VSTAIGAPVGSLRKAQLTNSTDASYPARLPTATKPAASNTRAVIPRGPGVIEATLEVVPYGTTTDNQTTNVLVLGWSHTDNGLWVPRTICEVSGILSATLKGVAGQDVLDTEFFCDTLGLTNGIAVLRPQTGAPAVANQDVASFLCDVGGVELIELLFKLGTAASQNALVRFL